MTEGAGRLSGRVVLITGAGGGIGGGIARALAAEGARLELVDINADASERAAEAIRASGGVADSRRLDVTDREAFAACVDDIVARHGRLDQLWNNAGLVQVGPLLDISAEEWRRIFAVNCDGVFYGTQAACRRMQDQSIDPDFGYRGKIVNVSSGAAENGRPMLAAYGATKAAVNHITKSAAAVFEERGICATILYPGDVYEGMWQHIDRVWSDFDGVPAGSHAAKRASENPLGKLQTPDELGVIARWIALQPGMSLSARITRATPGVLRA